MTDLVGGLSFQNPISQGHQVVSKCMQLDCMQQVLPNI